MLALAAVLFSFHVLLSVGVLISPPWDNPAKTVLKIFAALTAISFSFVVGYQAAPNPTGLSLCLCSLGLVLAIVGERFWKAFWTQFFNHFKLCG